MLPEAALSTWSIRLLVVCSALLSFTALAWGGSFQRTKDGQTLVWRDVPARGDEATWSGKSDKDGYATGSGVLTWYKTDRAIVTGSNILDTRRYSTLVSHYSGTMVRGKFKGAVTYIEAEGKRSVRRSANEINRHSRRQKANRTIARVKSTPAAEAALTPLSQPLVVDTPERTSEMAISTPVPEESSPPVTEELKTTTPPETAALDAQQTPTSPQPVPEQSSPQPQIAMSERTGALTAKRIAKPPAEEQPPQSDAQSAPVETQVGPNERSRSAPPFELPKPPRTIDEQTVGRLHMLYHSAVQANDAAIMDEILADDFVLQTDRGDSLTKADLIKEAQEKRTIYENEEVEKGTQKVRIWRDTAVVTALLKIKGSRDQTPFDYKVWMTETYVRTPTGWRYVFGQASKADTE
jgi:ketosteroid isomerase-like protein